MEELIRKRGRAKGKLTRIGSFAEQVNMATSADIKIRLEMLDSIWADFDSIQTKIECECSDTNLTVQQQEQEDFETKFCQVKGALIHTLEQIGITDGQGTHSQHANMMTHSDHTTSSNIKLPTIDLPTFDGDYLKWTSFSDLFKSAIHSNTSLGPAQKLHYLKSSVRGDAAKLLSTISVTDVNYMEAWTILNERFSNKRQIVASHLKAIYAQSKIHLESSRDIRRLLDTTIENLRALRALGLPTEHWDCLMVFTITERLDPNTRQHWELEVADTDSPTFSTLKAFLEKRCRALEASSMDRKSSHTIKSVGVTHKPAAYANTYHASTGTVIKGFVTCIICGENHQLFKCEKFLAFPIKQRVSHVKAASLCFNCLRAGHNSRNCTSTTCKRCHQPHNTLLHYETPSKKETTATEGTVVASHHVNHCFTPYQVLLATAVVSIEDNWGNHHNLRALLDAGSQVSFITSNCVHKLGLIPSKANMEITGVGASSVTSSRGAVTLTITSRCTDFHIEVSALILKRITGTLPSHPVSDSALGKVIQDSNLTLADPAFDRPGQIDLLLGADIYYSLLLPGQSTIESSKLSLQNTTLGWVVAGPSGVPKITTTVRSHLVTDELNNDIKRFWEIETISQPRMLTSEERKCEDHFTQTCSRSGSGRFMVLLPFKTNPDSLGESKQLAISRWLYIEKKLSTRPSVSAEYHDFMREYLALGHMELAPPDTKNKTYYLPHHFVIKEQSQSTKLRVVFDGSAQPRQGSSLNQALMVGPVVQEELTDIIMRFRIHNYVYTTDIAKMYRQILVQPAHRDFQRIVWRASPSENLLDYRLCTVTYGTSAAPFLATRSLTELASIGAATHPIAAGVLRQDCYVDDILTGADTVEEALALQSQLIDLLKLGGFQLHKWSASHPDLLQNINKENHNTTSVLDLSNGPLKTLGIFWCARTDSFTFCIGAMSLEHISKRTILSQICKLFDPLGWLAPVVILAKILIQRLWLVGAGWDDDLPTDIKEQWLQYSHQLHELEEIRIPRQMIVDSASRDLQLHGFCDSSERAYGAVVFIRSVVGTVIRVQLVCSKSRVAPLKKLTIPRLELCGAVLLAQLLSRIRMVLCLDLSKTFAWTDSTVVLAWLCGSPLSWKTFVANRVVEVVDLIPSEHWHHVMSGDNPADCLSRGMTAHDIKNHWLWWHGPNWLLGSETDWPIMIWYLSLYCCQVVKQGRSCHCHV